MDPSQPSYQSSNKPFLKVEAPQASPLYSAYEFSDKIVSSTLNLRVKKGTPLVLH